MNVGDLLLEDGELDVIRRLHQESAFNYKLPDFAGNPLFPIQRSVRHEGNFLAAVLVKIEAEVYLVVDHACGSPEDRFNGLGILHDDLVQRVREFGFDSMYCVLPPPVEKSFGPRLESVGWHKDRGWNKYTYELK